MIMIIMRLKDRGWKQELKGSFEAIESPIKDRKLGGKAANLSLEMSGSLEEIKVVDLENEGGDEDEEVGNINKSPSSELHRTDTAF